jgi:hypothetical protein
MTACVHNMIIEEDHNDNAYDQGWEFQNELVDTEPGPPTDLVDFLHMHHAMRDKTIYNQLQNDSVLHMWNHVETSCPLFEF